MMEPSGNFMHAAYMKQRILHGGDSIENAPELVHDTSMQECGHDHGCARALPLARTCAFYTPVYRTFHSTGGVRSW